MSGLDSNFLGPLFPLASKASPSGVDPHACRPRIRVSEAQGLGVAGLPRLQSEILSQSKQMKTRSALRNPATET